MDWCKILLQPISSAASGDALASAPSLSLCLPLIADGRISASAYRSHPAQATAACLRSGHVCREGWIELRDDQWVCIWPPQPGSELANTLILGGVFRRGKLVAMRRSHGVVELYRVAEIAKQPSLKVEK